MLLALDLVTDTEFFKRANMLDTNMAHQDNKDDPSKVARDGFNAMMNGESSIISGWKNKLQATVASVTPASILAEQSRQLAGPEAEKH